MMVLDAVNGDKRGSTEQSALPPAFYKCPAAGGCGGQGPLRRGYHVEQDRGDGASTWYSKRHTTFVVTVKPIRCACASVCRQSVGRNQCRVEVTADHASVIFTFLGLPGDPITSRLDASLPISTTSEPG